MVWLAKQIVAFMVIAVFAMYLFAFGSAFYWGWNDIPVAEHWPLPPLPGVYR